MTQPPSASRVSLRVWPGIVLAALLVIVRFGIPLAWPDFAGAAIIGAAAGSAGILLWWLFFSRAPWVERLAVPVLFAAGIFLTLPFVHASISNGMMGMMLPVYAVPPLAVALVLAAAVARHWRPTQRSALVAAAVVITCVAFLLIRTGGITGDAVSDLHWRWTPSPEERLLAGGNREGLAPPPVAAPAGSAETAPALAPARDVAAPAPADQPKAEPRRTTEPAGAPATPAIEEARTSVAVPVRAEWPGFRGPLRDSSVHGIRIDPDWVRTPPRELWRTPVGPGWSSFAVQGDLIYTQEQRGEEELVSCYRLTSGEPVWRHRDPVRFWESNGGAGPRGTPTLDRGRVYTMGATGIVNALDALTGARLWTRDAVAETGKTIPDWGIASSPLVVDDTVIVAVAGQLAAYDATTGEPKWMGEAGGGGYSSPHAVTVDGVRQVVLLRGARTISVSPADGTLLWEHRWQPAVSIVQPAISGEHDVIIGAGDAMGGLGLQRVTVGREGEGWRVEERWTSRGLKPYFNDFVLHEGHAYGFDGGILASVDLETGERAWKGGRYGHGQLMLLADQGLLLVLSEDGEIALVRAAPDRFAEVARVPALNGKTWNHPVLVGDVLLVRNGEEMVAFRLARIGS